MPYFGGDVSLKVKDDDDHTYYLVLKTTYSSQLKYPSSCLPTTFNSQIQLFKDH